MQYNPKAITVKTQGVVDPQCDIDGDLLVTDACEFTNLSASALIKTGPGFLIGVVINSKSNGTLKLWNNTSAATTVICNTIAFGDAERWIPFWGARFSVGLYATIGGTADITIMTN